MAPEISEDPESSNVLFRSSLEGDIYAVGATIFEIITGQDPFADMEDVSAIRTHVQRNGRPTPPADFDQNPLARYMPLVEECWKQRPEDRITIQELRSRLAQIDGSASVPASPASAPQSVKAEVSMLRSGEDDMGCANAFQAEYQ